MFDAQKRAALRAASEGETLHESIYIATLLGCVLYGLIMNMIMCAIIPYEWVFINYTLVVIGYFICVIAGTVIANKSSNPFISFIGYNMVVVPVGVIVAGIVGVYMEADPSIVTDAFMTTSIITAVMAVLGAIRPQWFEKLGGTLLTSLLAILITEVILLIFGISQYVTSWICILIFTMYIGYDTQKALKYPHTLDNAVDCAMDLYLDIINLFLRLIRIFAGSKSRSRSRR